MKRIAPKHLPQMRQQGLVIDELPDEVLVYDLEQHKAHCLNQTAALVWKYCDGRTTPPEIALRLEKDLQAPCPEEMVWLALRQLESLHLLEQPITLSAQLADLSRNQLKHVSRRQLMRTLGIGAVVAVPLITSIISPTAQAANSCLSSGSVCSSNVQCCPQGVGICDGSGHCL
jgi:hypothetical protein